MKLRRGFESRRGNTSNEITVLNQWKVGRNEAELRAGLGGAWVRGVRDVRDVGEERASCARCVRCMNKKREPPLVEHEPVASTIVWVCARVLDVTRARPSLSVYCLAALAAQGVGFVGQVPRFV